MTKSSALSLLQRQPARAWSLAGILLYNNWLLGIALNAHATFAGATTSELDIASQPWSWVFRNSDIAAGVCFLLGIRAVVRLGRTTFQRRVLFAGVAVLGLSTIIESFIPLQCSSALSSVCERQEALGAVGWQDWFHTGESVLSYACIAVLPLVAWWALQHQTNASAVRLRRISGILFGAMVIWAIESAIRFAHGAASYGLEQRFYIVLFSCWYLGVIFLGDNIFRKRKAR